MNFHNIFIRDIDIGIGMNGIAYFSFRREDRRIYV